jgi:hypothetical protein
MKMCLHYAVSKYLYVTFPIISVQQIKEELFVRSSSEYGVFVVTTIVYMVKTIRYVVASASRHDKRIAEGDEI